MSDNADIYSTSTFAEYYNQDLFADFFAWNLFSLWCWIFNDKMFISAIINIILIIAGLYKERERESVVCVFECPRYIQILYGSAYYKLGIYLKDLPQYTFILFGWKDSFNINGFHLIFCHYLKSKDVLSRRQYFTQHPVHCTPPYIL